MSGTEATEVQETEDTTETPNTDAQETDAQETEAQETEGTEETAEQKIARLERDLRSARQEAGKSRVNAKKTAAEERETEIVTKLLNVLGVTKTGEKKVTVSDLTAQLETAQAETRQLQLRDTIRTVAPSVQADPDRLLRDSVFLASASEADPTDQAAIKQLISDSLGDAPWLKAAETRAPQGRSGNDPSGGAGGSSMTLDDFRKLDGHELNKLFQTDPDVFRKFADS